MAALLENQNRRNPNPNSDPDREEIEYDFNSEGDETLFSEEDPSDEAFFVAGGDGEPKFDEEEETVTGIGIGAAVTITKSIKELRDLGECLPNLDSGNLDCTRSGPRIEGRSSGIRARINGSVTITRVVCCVTYPTKKFHCAELPRIANLLAAAKLKHTTLFQALVKNLSGSSDIRAPESINMFPGVNGKSDDDAPVNLIVLLEMVHPLRYR
ncbi:hypothetical protein CRG98_013954 [Punica granatum]|uniref:Uncharacterized protein n=1 Tax=Punica granatum TaxID=22663 RepID=A0A2I0KAV1_PUNGR|nr:hypothetical protein CRG98_013954 [Punica granatum]